MEKIKMTTPLVEMDGDEMTRILWKQIKEEVILPFVDLKTEYYDLGLIHREETKDQVTVDAANANKKYGVAVKCATITPNPQRMEEYPQLTQMWKSPNGTIRAILDGTVFRAPIMVNGISPVVKAPGSSPSPSPATPTATCTAPRVPRARPRQGQADLYRRRRPPHRTLARSFTSLTAPPCCRRQTTRTSPSAPLPAACFQYAIDTKQDLWFSTKDTISKVYDDTFKDIFQESTRPNTRPSLKPWASTYFYTLIDDAVARVIRSKGGFIWACKNYDGDVMSDMVSTAFGSLAMMTTVLVSPDGTTEFEAAHGTVTRHYYRYLKGETTSTNPMATIFAWSGALKKRGELDGIDALGHFADALEKATIDTIESGVMTGDLCAMWEGETPARKVTSLEFLREIRARMEQTLA